MPTAAQNAAATAASDARAVLGAIGNGGDVQGAAASSLASAKTLLPIVLGQQASPTEKAAVRQVVEAIDAAHAVVDAIANPPSRLTVLAYSSLSAAEAVVEALRGHECIDFFPWFDPYVAAPVLVSIS